MNAKPYTLFGLISLGYVFWTIRHCIHSFLFSTKPVFRGSASTPSQKLLYLLVQIYIKFTIVYVEVGVMGQTE